MPITKEERESYIASGEIASKAIEFARKRIKAGVSMLEFGESIESFIVENGGGLAFPINLSCNNEAAHYTPLPKDTRILGEHDLVKVDLGVHVDGCVADCAFSYSPDLANQKLILASLSALKKAIATIRPGAKTGEVGKVIFEEIISMGFNPIANLCGHSLAPYNVHAGEEVPNIPRGNYVFREGDVFAIEPFATDGEGFVRDLPACGIYSLGNGKSRLEQSRRLQAFVLEHFNTLPFSRRAIPDSLLGNSTELAIRDLVKNGGLNDYHVLAERPGKLVSQAETTVIVEADGALPTVKATIS